MLFFPKFFLPYTKNLLVCQNGYAFKPRAFSNGLVLSTAPLRIVKTKGKNNREHKIVFGAINKTDDEQPASIPEQKIIKTSDRVLH